MLEASEQVDQMSQEALHSFGFATEEDIEEVGGRLIELERRQHAVEQKLDHIIEMLEAAKEES